MTQTLKTKVLIIGAGTGGYVAGIRCGQLGLETVLVDAIDGDVAIARSRGDAPEIDGVVRIEAGGKLPVGDFAEVTIVGADAYDLRATLTKKTPRH
jgi:dihydrolipoamide dehydrogenase